MEKYKFFQHKDCEYFPCHKGIEEDNFNCLLCFCPLYPFCEDKWDCKDCLIPHKKENYDDIMNNLKTRYGNILP
jgi:Zn-finger protein